MQTDRKRQNTTSFIERKWEREKNCTGSLLLLQSRIEYCLNVTSVAVDRYMYIERVYTCRKKSSVFYCILYFISEFVHGVYYVVLYSTFYIVQLQKIHKNYCYVCNQQTTNVSSCTSSALWLLASWRCVYLCAFHIHSITFCFSSVIRFGATHIHIQTGLGSFTCVFFCFVLFFLEIPSIRFSYSLCIEVDCTSLRTHKQAKRNKMHLHILCLFVRKKKSVHLLFRSTLFSSSFIFVAFAVPFTKCIQCDFQQRHKRQLKLSKKQYMNGAKVHTLAIPVKIKWFGGVHSVWQQQLLGGVSRVHEERSILVYLDMFVVLQQWRVLCDIYDIVSIATTD